MLVNTVEQFEAVKPSLLACMDPCVDTETTGLSIFGNAERKRDVVIGIAIEDGREAYYFPFRHMLNRYNACHPFHHIHYNVRHQIHSSKFPLTTLHLHLPNHP